MRFHIECRFKSLTHPQAWTHVTTEPHVFTDEEVRMFKADLSPDDWEYGMEYRVRVHDDDVEMAHSLNCPVVWNIPQPLAPEADNDTPGRGPFNFVRQLMERAFLVGA